MLCSECNSGSIVEQQEIYQDCVTPLGMPERCIAIVVPVMECTVCGAKWLTPQAEDLIERAHFEAM